MNENNFQKKSHKGPERRRLSRLKREIVVQYMIKELPPIKGVQVTLRPPVDITRTRDLTEEGVLLTLSHAISPQTILDIKVKLPTQPQASLNLEGRVMSCKEIRKNLIYAIGVEFFNVKDKQKEALRNFIHLFLKG